MTATLMISPYLTAIFSALPPLKRRERCIQILVLTSITIEDVLKRIS
jgi:hypothetical protein